MYWYDVCVTYVSFGLIYEDSVMKQSVYLTVTHRIPMGRKSQLNVGKYTIHGSYG